MCLGRQVLSAEGLVLVTSAIKDGRKEGWKEGRKEGRVARDWFNGRLPSGQCLSSACEQLCDSCPILVIYNSVCFAF